ncbi:hypothetical protein F5Y00DRAFT_150988 [Daldinia vernicosa]|uniref:uncharacterized protein n=1 Tax=Daldinia vernicosa TaxID=114800 RepID=UPI002008232D|nr:uncharacterized protein F5Y00DRAFT_150988 [Daldinia vernicosa]KAI0846060.1 hypothetical protein F5Y00DRAFT_150988 [Daldinia vernicosa]
MASLYELTIPVLTRALRTEQTLLKKAEEYSKSTGTPIEELVSARLAPDMFSLSKQVGVTVLFARFASHLLAGKELVPTQLGEWSLEENHSIIADVLKFLADIKPEDVDGKESEVISFNVGPRKTSAKAIDCLLPFDHPLRYSEAQGRAVGQDRLLGAPS